MEPVSNGSPTPPPQFESPISQKSLFQDRRDRKHEGFQLFLMRHRMDSALITSFAAITRPFFSDKYSNNILV